jgi:hypothetical protein
VRSNFAGFERKTSKRSNADRKIVRAAERIAALLVHIGVTFAGECTMNFGAVDTGAEIPGRLNRERRFPASGAVLHRVRYLVEMSSSGWSLASYAG